MMRAPIARKAAMRKRVTVKTRIARRELEESRALVIARSGARCESCGAPATDVHHRRPRMAGGSTAVGINSPSNLVAACRPCHEGFERDRTEALAEGWLLSDVRHAPRVAIYHHSLGWVRLLDDGSYEDATDGAA